MEMESKWSKKNPLQVLIATVYDFKLAMIIYLIS